MAEVAQRTSGEKSLSSKRVSLLLNLCRPPKPTAKGI